MPSVRPSFVRRAAVTAGAALVAALLPVAAPVHAAPPASSYVNPVSKGFADTFADPSVIRGKDGLWYSYATSDPLRAGEPAHTLPTARSSDLVNWSFVGDAFTAGNRPTWATPTAGIWAPDIRYVDGRYYLYYVVTDTVIDPNRDNDSAIGVATGPTPTGPWTDSGAPVVGPRPGNGSYLWTYDPAELTDRAGNRWLYYGSYNGGMYVTPLTPDGLHAMGPATQVAIDNRYEGAYVVEHAGYYYLLASQGDCCAGPTTGYSVFAGRSLRPDGPFVDRDGIGLTDSRVGGTAVVQPNGNRWVGTGHNAMLTDLAGQDWLFYHAIDRADPFLNEPFGINQRPMLADRLDWIDGWPTVRAGAWASDTSQPAPVTTGPVHEGFDGTALSSDWRAAGAWQVTGGAAMHAAATTTPCTTDTLVSATAAPAKLRLEADLRQAGPGASGVVAAYANSSNYVAAWLDADTHVLAVEVWVAGALAARTTSPLPDGFRYDTFHNVAVQIRGAGLHAEVTDSRLHDVLATVDRTLPKGAATSGSVGVASRCARTVADNVSAAALYSPVKTAVAVPVVGALAPAYSDEFSGDALDPAWSWVRTPAGSETGGAYVWPTQAGDLFKGSNNASVLLRDAPTGAYTVEAKLTLDLGVNDVRNFQQAGLVEYVNDDDFLKHVSVAIWNTRQTEFAKEARFADGIAYGSMAIGTPAPTGWLRLAHRVDPTSGEHAYRAASSRDGIAWTWGGTWTEPAGTSPRIGLVSMGGVGATAQFDYVRVFQP